MNITSHAIASACALILGVAGNAFAATSEPIGLDAGIDAKVSRERARGAAERHRRDEEQRARDNADCGTVDIGNFTSGRGAGFGRVPREITVVVQGDVVNANNRCRN